MCVQLHKALFLNRLLLFSVLRIQQSIKHIYIHTYNERHKHIPYLISDVDQLGQLDQPYMC